MPLPEAAPIVESAAAVPLARTLLCDEAPRDPDAEEEEALLSTGGASAAARIVGPKAAAMTAVVLGLLAVAAVGTGWTSQGTPGDRATALYKHDGTDRDLDWAPDRDLGRETTSEGLPADTTASDQEAPCVDTDGGAADSADDGCEKWYTGREFNCPSNGGPSYDDMDFTADDMCCTCGGGELLRHS